MTSTTEKVHDIKDLIYWSAAFQHFLYSLGYFRSRTKRRTPEKPWYDVSDEEVDMSVPDHITSIISVRGSSDDDVF